MSATEDRSDTCGVLIDRRSTQFGVVLVAQSLLSGAAMSANGRRAIQRATRDEGLPCLVVAENDPERIIGVAGPADFRNAVESKAVNGVIRLGSQKDWVNNIVAAATKGEIYPGLNHGR